MTHDPSDTSPRTVYRPINSSLRLVTEYSYICTNFYRKYALFLLCSYCSRTSPIHQHGSSKVRAVRTAHGKWEVRRTLVVVSYKLTKCQPHIWPMRSQLLNSQKIMNVIWNSLLRSMKFIVGERPTVRMILFFVRDEYVVYKHEYKRDINNCCVTKMLFGRTWEEVDDY